MNIYDYTDYRIAIQHLVEVTKVHRQDLSYAKLADKVGIQRSYLTNVLKGRADLNSDQLYKLAEELGLDDQAIDYFILILEIEKCQIPSRRKKLESKRDALQEELRSNSYRIKAESVSVSDQYVNQYYSDPLLILIHAFLDVSEYRKDINLIAEKLNISKSTVEEKLSILLKSQLVVATEKGLKLTKSQLHLDHHNVYLSKLHGSHFRIKAIERLQFHNLKQDHFFTTTFSANANFMSQIDKYWEQFIQSVSEKAMGSKSEDVYQLNFDCFKY